MEKYKVRSLNGESSEISDKKEAFKVYKQWKESDMEEGVVIGESYVELVVSVDEFKTERLIEKVIATLDDYWVKW